MGHFEPKRCQQNIGYHWTLPSIGKILESKISRPYFAVIKKYLVFWVILSPEMPNISYAFLVDIGRSYLLCTATDLCHAASHPWLRQARIVHKRSEVFFSFLHFGNWLPFDQVQITCGFEGVLYVSWLHCTPISKKLGEKSQDCW